MATIYSPKGGDMSTAEGGPPGWQCLHGHANSPETWRCADDCTDLRVVDTSNEEEVEAYVAWSRNEILNNDVRFAMADEEIRRLIELIDEAAGATPPTTGPSLGRRIGNAIADIKAEGLEGLKRRLRGY